MRLKFEQGSGEVRSVRKWMIVKKQDKEEEDTEIGRRPKIRRYEQQKRK